MEFKSIPDILRFSISKEQASVQFYRDMISKTLDPATKSLFEVLIQKEQEHIAALQFEIEKLGRTVDIDTEQSDPAFHWEERLEADEPLIHMGFVDALLMGIQKERAAFRLYTKIMATVTDERLSGVLLALAEEEMRHVLQLEREYETIAHHKD
jgi:rubrerythrin